MKKELVIRSNSSAVDFALLNNGKLIELNQEIDSNKFSVGDIFISSIRKPVAGLNAAFINVGYQKDGFLHYHDLGPRLSSVLKFVSLVQKGKRKIFYCRIFIMKRYPKRWKIEDFIRPKQRILVQIVKEPISSKGPRVSSELSLAGRFMVLIPFSDRVSISQKIESKEEKSRLNKIVKSIRPKGFGIIIRTVAKIKVAELDSDLQRLLNRWKNMCEKLTKVDKYPAKILSEINQSSSILRDIFDDNFTGIHVDDSEMYSEIKDYIQTIAPKKTSIVNLYESHVPIFERYGIERQIKTSFGKTVSMQKGSYLIIEHTEALHVIDVNSGNQSNRSKSKSQEESALEVNMIAASEIARQVKLRDLGGIIVVDFIDLTSNENRKKLFEHLKNEMSNDRTKHKILPPSKFGLIQITRQRVRPEMNIKTKEPNPNEANEVEAPIIILEKINAELDKISKHTRYKKEKIFLHTHPFIAAYLNQGIPSIRMKWFLKYNKWIHIIPRDAFFYLKFLFLDNNKKFIKIK